MGADSTTGTKAQRPEAVVASSLKRRRMGVADPQTYLKFAGDGQPRSSVSRSWTPQDRRPMTAAVTNQLNFGAQHLRASVR